MNGRSLGVRVNEQLALRHKISGKIASRKDQGRVAIQLEALRLEGGAKGGGIVSFLLPRSLPDRATVKAVERLYEVSRVATRPGKPGYTTVKKSIQLALANDDFMTRLAVAFTSYVGTKAGPHSTSALAFANWLKRELSNKRSSTYKMVSSAAPTLLECERGARWWIDALNQRRKTQS